MLPFQKTSVYRQTLATINEIMQTMGKKDVPLLKKHIEEEGILVTTNIAKAFAVADGRDMDQHFDKAGENITGMIALLDLALKNSAISIEEKDRISAQLRQLKNSISNYKQNRKKIMILSAEMGQGHMSASKAIKEAIEHNYGYDYGVEIVDFQQILSSFINNFTKNTYESWVKFTPSLYKLLYESTNTRVPIIKLLNQFNYPFVLTRLTKFFQERNPDIVISTFPVWSYLASEIWKKTNKDAKFISVVTDSITIHKSWVIADTDYHIVANNDTANSLRKLGVPKEKIKTLGFPVRLDFMDATDRSAFLKSHKLNPSKFTLLFLPTSQQQRKNIRIIKELADGNNFNIIIITGRDSKLKPRLEKFSTSNNIRIFGWTDQISKFLQASDLVITKAGGATVMECLAACKPMVITSIIPGQEMGNAELIQRYHLGIIADNEKYSVRDGVDFIKDNYKSYSRNISKFSNPEASLRIADFIAELIEN